MELTEFLLERIGEDEAVARGAYPGGRWQVAANGYGGHGIEALDVHAHELPDVPETVVDDESGSVPPEVSAMHHIARWDPSRALAECEAKRQIVAWCSERNLISINPLGDPTDPANYISGRHAHEQDAPVLRMLAMPYADHPDYRPDWGP